MTKKSQCDIGNFLDVLIQNQIPDDIYDGIVMLIRGLAYEVVKFDRRNRYLRKKCDKTQEFYSKWHFNDNRNYNDDNEPIMPSKTTQYKKLKLMQEYIHEVDTSAGELVNLTHKFALRLVDQSESLSEQLYHKFEKKFIQRKNLLIQEMDADKEYAARIFFNGFLTGWTNRDYEVFNKLV